MPYDEQSPRIFQRLSELTSCALESRCAFPLLFSHVGLEHIVMIFSGGFENTGAQGALQNHISVGHPRYSASSASSRH